MPPSTSPLPRLALRVSLLGGVLLDSALAATCLWEDVGAEVLSYPRSWLPLLAVRTGVQILACYDRRRYDPLVPLVGLSWLGGYGLVVQADPATWLALSPAAVIGLAQLVLWKGTR